MSGWVEVPASMSGATIAVLLDHDDVVRLGGRRLSVASHGYAQMYTPERRVELLHRWLLGLARGDRRIGDHINGDTLDNRRTNLRIVTPTESSANCSARGSTGFRGVYRARTRFEAKVQVAGRTYRLGLFDTPEEADAAIHAWRLENMPGYVDRPGARKALRTTAASVDQSKEGA